LNGLPSKEKKRLWFPKKKKKEKLGAAFWQTFVSSGKKGFHQ